MRKMIWEWIKTMVHKIADLIPRRFRREVTEEPEPAPGQLTELDKRLGKEILKKQARGVGRPVDTHQGGPNMPKYQPCPRGHGMKRRTQKTAGGAYYACQQCGKFFVRAPGL